MIRLLTSLFRSREKSLTWASRQPKVRVRIQIGGTEITK
jgi:hypothetical protein